MRWKPERGCASTCATKIALADLESLLVLLQQLALGVDRGAARELVREALGRRVDELGHAQLPRQSVGELVVDRLHVAAEVLDPRGVGLRRARITPQPGAGCRSRARACRPRSAATVPVRRSLTVIVQPIVSLIRPDTRPRSSASA